jgi:ethanolamine utilization protein EutA
MIKGKLAKPVLLILTGAVMHDDPKYHGSDFQAMKDHEHPFWLLDTVTLTSVGIDIGSATTQVIFSRLFLRRLGRELSSRFTVVSREALYLSPVYLTPYATGRERIDEQALGRLVDVAFREAGLRPDEVNTGAVILTGEAIRRENAQAIAELFSAEKGDFVCASAGHRFEALLAAHGSGAVAISGEQGIRLLNIDIGGGTTKLAIVERGCVLETAAFHVGGRLLSTDPAGKITLLEPGGAALARKAGFAWSLGDQVAPAQIEQMAQWMADAVISLVTLDQPPPEIRELLLTDPLSLSKKYDGVLFSGGVGEYVYGKEARGFGDLGQPFGAALRRRIEAGCFPWPIIPARECIRATVMGASQYSVQVSGNTIYDLHAETLLPRRNLQVLRPYLDLSGEIDSRMVAEAIRKHFDAFDLEEGGKDVALVFAWLGDPLAVRLAGLCAGIVQGLPSTLAQCKPIFLVFEGDIGGLVGNILKEELRIESQVISIDGISLRDFDFIDIGQVLLPSGTVPVTIKSLIFQL